MRRPLFSMHQCCGECNGRFCVHAVELQGCVRLELAQGDVPLNPQDAVLRGMLAGEDRTRIMVAMAFLT
jgi:hypothetical protein